MKKSVLMIRTVLIIMVVLAAFGYIGHGVAYILNNKHLANDCMILMLILLLPIFGASIMEFELNK